MITRARRPPRIPDFETLADVENGKLTMLDPAGYRRHVTHISSRGRVRVQVAITTPKQSKRSTQANNYYWFILDLISSDTTAGNVTAEQLHDAMCEMFLPNETKRVEFFNRMTGECLTVETDVRRSSKLTGEAFYIFVEQVRKWALEFLGIITPDPDPLYWRKREKKGKAA